MADYTDLLTVKLVVGIDPDDPTADEILNRAIRVCSRMLDRKLRTAFSDQVQETRHFDAPTGSYLRTPGLLIPDDPGGITAYNVTIPASEYHLAPTPLLLPATTPYEGVILLSADGVPLDWRRLSLLPDPVYNRVSISGAWVQLAPDEIVQACEMMVARLWNMRIHQYSGEGGNSTLGRTAMASGFWSPEIEELIAPYQKTTIRKIIGV